mgnify:FL=1
MAEKRVNPTADPWAEVAERLGAVPEREITLRGAPCTIWRHPAEGTA